MKLKTVYQPEGEIAIFKTSRAYVELRPENEEEIREIQNLLERGFFCKGSLHPSLEESYIYLPLYHGLVPSTPEIS